MVEDVIVFKITWVLRKIVVHRKITNNDIGVCDDVF